MNKYRVKFQRDFEVEIQAVDLDTAEGIARSIVSQFPVDTAKLLSIVQDGVQIQPTPGKPPTKPWGRPNGGGSPGTPVLPRELPQFGYARTGTNNELI